MTNKGKLSTPGFNKALSAAILEDIDEYCVNTYDGGHRNHLGGSQIGEECQRKLWYIFRWVLKDKMEKEDNTAAENLTNRGRMQRLFQRGHKEEFSFIEYLEGIGCKVWADDLNNNVLWYHPESDCYTVESKEHDEEIDLNLVDVSDEEKHIKRARADGLQFKQYRISGVNGHFGGSLDGIVKLPERFEIDEPLLLEFKTSATKGFKDLVKKGVAMSKPVHFAQMSTYGYYYHFTHALYMCVCKETDALHIEIVKLDHNLGLQMFRKAERIIISQTEPPKLSENETFFKCKWCHFNKICHSNATTEVNCRSCVNARPIENGEWYCDVNEFAIDKDLMKKGCTNKYKSVNQKV